MRSDEIRGVEAEQLLANPLLKEALATIESRLVEQLSLAEIEPARVVRLQALLAAKRTFERYLRSVVQTGQMVEEEESRKRKLRERMTNLFRAA